jgi:hypothetical protein
MKTIFVALTLSARRDVVFSDVKLTGGTWLRPAVSASRAPSVPPRTRSTAPASER